MSWHKQLNLGCGYWPMLLSSGGGAGDTLAAFCGEVGGDSVVVDIACPIDNTVSEVRYSVGSDTVFKVKVVPPWAAKLFLRYIVE